MRAIAGKTKNENVGHNDLSPFPHNQTPEKPNAQVQPHISSSCQYI